MAKVFFTCFAPFNYFTDRKRVFSSVDTDEEMSGLFFSLELDLQRLRLLLSKNDSITLQWCTEAMLFVQKMHSCLLPFFERSYSEDPFSWDGHVSVVEEYMKETLDVLDLCNLIKSAISAINRYRMMFDLATKRFSENGLSKVKIERMVMVKKDDCCRPLGAKKWKHDKLYLTGIRNSDQAELKKDTNNTDIRVVCVIGKAMNVISMLIVSSILSPSPIQLADDGSRETCCNVSWLNSFSGSVRDLVSCFNKKLQCIGEKANIVLAENKEMLEGAISGFKYQDVEVEREITEMLKQRSDAIREGSELFESAVNQVFEGVVKGRKQVLGLVSQDKFNLFHAT